MSNKCVHEWYYRIVDIVSWQFFCIRCGEKLSMDKFSNHTTELEKNADALHARIAELKELLDTESQLSNQFYLLLVDNPKSKKLADDLIEALRINGKEVQK